MLATSSASAQTEATPLEEGDLAPYAGILLTHELAARLGTKAERCALVSKLENEHGARVCAVKLDGAAARLKLADDAHTAKVSILEADRDDARERARRALWERPDLILAVGLAAGLLAGVGISAGAIWAIGQLRPAIPPG